MKKLNLIILISAAITLASCGGGITKQPANSAGFGAIEKEIKSKFGESAYYTDLNISYDQSIGNMISTTVTNDPESLKMEQWDFSMGNWNQSSEVTLEVSEGSKAADFMFQLNDKINLKKLGELIEQSITKLKAEKDLKNPTLSMAFIKFPKNGDITKAEYSISLKPENGGTTFSFYYKLDGEFIEMDY